MMGKRKREGEREVGVGEKEIRERGSRREGGRERERRELGDHENFSSLGGGILSHP